MRLPILTDLPVVVVMGALMAKMPLPPLSKIPLDVVPEMDTSLVVALPMVPALILVPLMPLADALFTSNPTIVLPSPKVIALPAELPTVGRVPPSVGLTVVMSEPGLIPISKSKVVPVAACPTRDSPALSVIPPV